MTANSYLQQTVKKLGYRQSRGDTYFPSLLRHRSFSPIPELVPIICVGTNREALSHAGPGNASLHFVHLELIDSMRY